MPEAPLIIQGGQAIAPREVEQDLLRHPAVAEVAVVGVPDRCLGQVVAAAVRLSAPLPAPAADLARYCEARLARYKVPARWLFTSALPRTAAGEPRRAMLRAQLAVMPRPAGPDRHVTGPPARLGGRAGGGGPR
jgi:acyl-CoA synthetase (AMP-forming)/AMP-acid ligase II